jgi:hypothetical protein
MLQINSLHKNGSREIKGKGKCHPVTGHEGRSRRRATTRPHFSGHVLIFKALIIAREEFIRLRRMSGNLVYSHFILLLSF